MLIGIDRSFDNIFKAMYLDDMELCIDVFFDDLVECGKIDESTLEDVKFDIKDQEKDEFDDQSKMDFLCDYVEDFFQEIKEGAY